MRAPGKYRTAGQAHLVDAVHLAGGITQDAAVDSAQLFRTQSDGTLKIMSVDLDVNRDHVLQCGLEPEELLMKTAMSSPYIAERMKNGERTSQIYVRKDFSFRMDPIATLAPAMIAAGPPPRRTTASITPARTPFT